MKRLLAATLVLAIVGMAAIARADEKSNPTGTWKWTVKFGDRSAEMTLKLKLDGDKLSGAMLGRDGKENPVEDATYKDSEVSFKVVRERQGAKMTSTYTGKVSGDTITGKIQFERGGNAQSRDWEAKRAKD
jgi:hypothetical protein